MCATICVKADMHKVQIPTQHKSSRAVAANIISAKSEQLHQSIQSKTWHTLAQHTGETLVCVCVCVARLFQFALLPPDKHQTRTIAQTKHGKSCCRARLAGREQTSMAANMTNTYF